MSRALMLFFLTERFVAFDAICDQQNAAHSLNFIYCINQNILLVGHLLLKKTHLLEISILYKVPT
jgi:hypothetical protein